jgi:hypothetical protein
LDAQLSAQEEALPAALILNSPIPDYVSVEVAV